MEDSVFTKIIKGEIPCDKIYEDEKTIAFLTIEPYVEGHTLVVPKVQVDKFYDLSAEDSKALFTTVKKVARHLEKIAEAKRVVEMIYGFDVPHAHVHLIPVQDTTKYTEAFRRHLTHEKPYPYAPSKEELAAVAKKYKIEEK